MTEELFRMTDKPYMQKYLFIQTSHWNTQPLNWKSSLIVLSIF